MSGTVIDPGDNIANKNFLPSWHLHSCGEDGHKQDKQKDTSWC